jgi:ABC-2 type transport system permease protein
MKPLLRAELIKLRTTRTFAGLAGAAIVMLGRNAIVAALTGALAVGLGALVRNQVIAVVGLLLLGLLIEPTVTTVLPEAGRYGPFVGLPTALADIPAEDAGLGEVDLLAPGLAAMVMMAWIGAAFAAGYALLRGRDVH